MFLLPEAMASIKTLQTENKLQYPFQETQYDDVPVSGRTTEEFSQGESDRRRTGSLIINSVDHAHHLASLEVNGEKADCESYYRDRIPKVVQLEEDSIRNGVTILRVSDGDTLLICPRGWNVFYYLHVDRCTRCHSDFPFSSLTTNKSHLTELGLLVLFQHNTVLALVYRHYIKIYQAVTQKYYPLSYGVPVRERCGSTLLPATREQHDQNCTQSH